MVEPDLPQNVDVQALMRQLRARIRGENREHEWIRQARKAVPSHLASSVGRLRAGAASLRIAIALIGQPPPSPATLRGKLGLLLIRAVQRALFWLVPSIQTALNQIVDALDTHVKATEDILTVLEQTNIELARLREQIPPTVPAAGTGQDALPVAPPATAGRIRQG